mmetsp:Transcript_3819/g.4283  ORF Transcript_3819/g.4283 Transcript_3819/m.4283 type:complete len:330 (-) Transcript_3819:235-1224(-)|eukprot:CAMPEP_0184052252 /NCGR_PEP_ID=MMETSP0956-20121227/5182_1 /TAXON_ID=627963 /ORGANISM="Aplanochytrium sp, Strain PBS07" /LENGTH=329 /DNA_ID=CAMNT_0026345273 /DNA_START=16 /DNA_END=1005 /DNA_ORIENTATION=-
MVDKDKDSSMTLFPEYKNSLYNMEKYHAIGEFEENIWKNQPPDEFSMQDPHLDSEYIEPLVFYEDQPSLGNEVLISTDHAEPDTQPLKPIDFENPSNNQALKEDKQHEKTEKRTQVRTGTKLRKFVQAGKKGEESSYSDQRTDFHDDPPHKVAANKNKNKNWSELEEILLVGVVFDRFFSQGSLSNGGKKKRDAIWDVLQQRFCALLKAYAKRNQTSGEFVERSPMAISRHYKVMKSRVSKSRDSETDDPIDFRKYFKAYECLRLDETATCATARSGPRTQGGADCSRFKRRHTSEARPTSSSSEDGGLEYVDQANARRRKRLRCRHTN